MLTQGDVVVPSGCCAGAMMKFPIALTLLTIIGYLFLSVSKFVNAGISSVRQNEVNVVTVLWCTDEVAAHKHQSQ